jgi:hypothetical protein
MANCQGQLDLTFVVPSCRAILSRLEQERGISVTALANPLAIALPVAMKHLDVPQNAGRVTGPKVDRTVAVRLAPDPMREDLRPSAEGTELTFSHSRLHDDETASSHKVGWNVTSAN